MYTNIHYDGRNSQIHIWEKTGDKKTYNTYKWSPFVYLPTEKETGIRSIYGDWVYRKEFDSNRDYNEFIRNNNDIYEDKVPPQIQFLADSFNSDDPVLPELHIAYIDIETPYNDGFPKVKDVPAPIVLISVIDEKNKTTVFGIHDYSGDHHGSIKYVKCKDEADLLNTFFNWMHREQFDLITGWNILCDSKTNKYGGFDIPYIIRRSIKLFGENGSQHNKLSPINIVRIWDSTVEDVFNVDIAGISVIDYLGLYKWFTTKNLESYSLDYVSEVELGRNKVDHTHYDTFWEFYEKDWNLFVDYCIEDTQLVKDIESKTGYISLAQTLSCYCCCPMKNFNASVPLIEGLMLKYYRKNNLCAPKMEGGSQVWFPAAYVKPPYIGLHKDVVDLDITSSYPTAIITLNMSTETYWGRIIGFRKEDVQMYKLDKGIHEPLHDGRPIYDINVKYTRERQFPPFHVLKSSGMEVIQGEKLGRFNKLLKHNMLSIAPNGAVFLNKPKGVIAEVEKFVFLERKKQKGLKGEYKRKAMEDPENEKKWNEMSKNRDVLQWAIKILINSMFGITGVPYCRYFNPHIAEAITSCGRHTIKQGQVFVNDLLNDPNDDLLSIVKEIKEKVN